MATGLLDYFPDALAAVAETSRVGNDQHNAGQPLHWAKDKSTDHADSLLRHLVDRGTLDTDGIRHSAKVAWRALALLQTELEWAEHAEEKGHEMRLFTPEHEADLRAGLRANPGPPPPEAWLPIQDPALD